jgi:Protein of unknown function (DUF3987)
MSVTPSEDFIENYMTYASGNEVPKSFHVASALATLSSLAARRVWFDQGTFVVYPNLYVVMVGKPSDKKSTAMNIAKKLSQLCGVPAAPSAVTRERIYELMDSKNTSSSCNQAFVWKDEEVKMSRLALFCNELVTLLSAGGEPLGMIEFLTDIWDKDAHEIETKNKGKNLIIGPCMTMLACMTPDQTQGLLKQSIITGGFSRRCLFITPDGASNPVPLPFITPEQKAAWSKLLEIGKSFDDVKGPFVMTPECIEFYSTWYLKNFEDRQKPNSPLVGYYYNTLPRYVLQVAMLFGLSKDRACREINVENTKKAIGWLEPIALTLDEIFTGAGRNPLSALQAKIKSVLTASPVPVKLKIIQAQLFDHCNLTELQEVIQHMTSTSQVTVDTLGGMVVVRLVGKDYYDAKTAFLDPPAGG